MAMPGRARMPIQGYVTLKDPYPDRNFSAELIKGQKGGIAYETGTEKHHVFDQRDPVFAIRGSGLAPGSKRKYFVSLNGMRLVNDNVEETEDNIQFIGFNTSNWSPTGESYGDKNGLGFDVAGGEEVMIPLSAPVSAGDILVWSLPHPRDPNFKQQHKPGFPLERITPQFHPLDWRESAYMLDAMVVQMLSSESQVKKRSMPDHRTDDSLLGLNKEEVAAFHSRKRTLMTIMRGVEVLLQRRIIDILSTEQQEIRQLEEEIADIVAESISNGVIVPDLTAQVTRRDELKAKLNSTDVKSAFSRAGFSLENAFVNGDDRLNSKYTLNQWKIQDPRNPATTESEVNDTLNANRNKVFWLANALGVMGVSRRSLPSETLIDDIIRTIYVGCLDPKVSDQYLALFPASESSINDEVTRIHVGQYLANAVNHVKDEAIAMATAQDHITRRVIGVATGHNNNTSAHMTPTPIYYHP